jgi:hypothetical protein
MIYEYRCSICERVEEVSHSMDEVDNPTKETILATTCNENTCKEPIHDHVVYGKQWKRVPSMPNLLYFGTGTHSKGGLKTLDEKSKYADKRSSEHSKKEGIDELQRERKNDAKKQFEGK